jgi:hypothetical protein
VNETILAALSGALASYLVQRGTPLDDVRVMVPVNLRPLDSPLPAELGNHFGFFFVDMPTAPMRPLERLVEVHRRVESLKGSPEALVTYGVLAGLGAAPKAVEDLGVASSAARRAGWSPTSPGPAGR